MKKYMSISEFMNRDFTDESIIKKITSHIKRNKTFYITVGSYTLIFICTGMDVSSAAGAVNANIFDKGAFMIYNTLVSVGKWIVIAKAGIDIIGCATHGDFASMKTKLLGYLIVFLALLGLPWAFDQVDKLFQAQSTAG